jgi:hypothetical protein
MDAFEMLRRCWERQWPLYSNDVADVSAAYDRAIDLNRDRLPSNYEYAPIPLDPDWAPPAGAWDQSWS